MLKGNKTMLRPIELEDSRILSTWLNDRETNKGLDIIYPLSKRYADSFVLEAEDERKRIFMIDDEEYKPIGIVIIDKIKWEYRHCEIGIAIYKKEKRGQGYGKDSLKTLLDFIFNDMNMNLVYLNVLENNIPAINLYKSLGFTQEGILRNRYYQGGKYYNIISMSLTREELVTVL
ncbi:GNAT family N-acetyltransferase [Clostridium cylindrosporum]|uniref:Acetyltransferase, ribosomal protein N-acetylase n=1 Tax=Clostridium cylindrosporum DSM 605 TaxID=1121307 RepID=A0A0J8D9B4_CLOCY|nr:GNAT family protein [Clostridium cylindrosporum]KMT22625.1 acetyltransferase, ribosomal protein N-acetylase [Clostridium cylindrosporum DSM 605]